MFTCFVIFLYLFPFVSEPAILTSIVRSLQLPPKKRVNKELGSCQTLLINKFQHVLNFFIVPLKQTQNRMKLMADNYDDDHHHYHHHHHHHHHRSPGRPQHSNHRPSPDQVSPFFSMLHFCNFTVLISQGETNIPQIKQAILVMCSLSRN